MKYRLLLLLLVCLTGLPMSASAIPLNLVDMRKALVDLPTRKLPEAEQQAAQQSIEQSITWLETVERTELAQEQLQEQLASAPKQIAEAQAALQSLLDAAQDDPSKRLANASVKELEDLLAEKNSKLSTLQKDFNDTNALIVSAQTRPERAQAEISSNQVRIQEINNLLKTAKDSDKLLNSEKIDALRAELLALESKSNLRRAELSGNSVLQELASSRRDLLLTEVGRQEHEILILQSLLN